ncbi:MAG: peptidoglycan DD-metalloendopeptidase family protein [Rhodospirillales bacterium]
MDTLVPVLRSYLRISFYVSALVVLPAALSHAAPDDKSAGKGVQKLEDVERALQNEREQKRRLDREARDLEQELSRLRDEIVTAAQKAQAHEDEATELENRILELDAREVESRVQLQKSRGQTGRVLMALTRMARNPPEALFVQPSLPSQTVRSAILLRAAVPEIEQRAGRLRERLADVAAARDAVAERRKRLQNVMASLHRQQERIGALVEQKAKIKTKAEAERERSAKRVAALARRAKSLRELMETLEREEQKQTERRRIERKKKPKAPVVSLETDPGLPITKSRGTLVQPAIGRLVGRYGGSSGTGLRRKGISIETRQDAQIVAPFRGKAVFADRFRGYGRLLIIDHGEGYHTLLAGLARIAVQVGQVVVAGEPVGVMAGSPQDIKPVLYVELRRKGQPINPLPWLTTQNAKVNK